MTSKAPTANPHGQEHRRRSPSQWRQVELGHLPAPVIFALTEEDGFDWEFPSNSQAWLSVWAGPPPAAVGEALRSSGVPALVLWGEHDTIFPVDGVARPLAEMLSAQLVLVPGGHFTPLDCPNEVAAALRDFLSRLPP